MLVISDNYSPLIGLANCYVESKQNEKAIVLLRDNLQKFVNTAYQYEIEFLRADLLARNNQLSKADSIYKSLILRNPTRTLFGLTTLRTDLVQADTVLIRYLSSEGIEKYSILNSLNQKGYNYKTFPYLVSLAKSSGIEYDDFLSNFTQVLRVSDYESCYAVYKLSLYMCEKMDFERARKLAALSLRYSEDVSFNPILNSNFEKMNWLYKNHEKILSSLVYQ